MANFINVLFTIFVIISLLIIGFFAGVSAILDWNDCVLYRYETIMKKNTLAIDQYNRAKDLYDDEASKNIIIMKLNNIQQVL